MTYPRIQQHSKKIIPHDQVGFIIRMQDFYNKSNQIYVLYTTLK